MIAIIISILISFLNLYNQAYSNYYADYSSSIYMPTYITKLQDDYFIVDCYHHRIIYSDDIKKPVSQWKTMSDNLVYPHSIDSDGEIFITESTGQNKILVFKKNKDGSFTNTQTFENMGFRPHRTVYDPKTKLFYVIGSQSAEMFIFRDVDGKAELINDAKLPFFSRTDYCRSFRIIDGYMVFVSGSGKIRFTEYEDQSFSVIKEYDVPKELEGMDDIIKIDDYYYISAFTDQLVRIKDLNDLKGGKYETLENKLGFNGSPYYFSQFDGRVYLPQLDHYSGINSFVINKDNKISDIQKNFDFGNLPSDASKKRDDIMKNWDSKQ